MRWYICFFFVALVWCRMTLAQEASHTKQIGGESVAIRWNASLFIPMISVNLAITMMTCLPVSVKPSTTCKVWTLNPKAAPTKSQDSGAHSYLDFKPGGDNNTPTPRIRWSCMPEQKKKDRDAHDNVAFQCWQGGASMWDNHRKPQEAHRPSLTN